MVKIDDSILHLKDNDLSVMLYFLTHASNDGVCEVSYSILSEELELSVQNCRTAIRHLKATGKVTSNPTSKITYITICGYERYKASEQSEQQTIQQAIQQAKIDELQAKIEEQQSKISELEEALRKKKTKSHEVSPKSLEEKKAEMKIRAQAFYDTLIPFVQSRGGAYPKEMIRAFYNYWTEPNRTFTKMRFEKEDTWEIGRRLSTWANRNNDFRNNETNRQLTSTDRTTIAAESTMAKLLATNKPVE